MIRRLSFLVILVLMLAPSTVRALPIPTTNEFLDMYRLGIVLGVKADIALGDSHPGQNLWVGESFSYGQGLIQIGSGEALDGTDHFFWAYMRGTPGQPDWDYHEYLWGNPGRSLHTFVVYRGSDLLWRLQVDGVTALYLDDSYRLGQSLRKVEIDAEGEDAYVLGGTLSEPARLGTMRILSGSWIIPPSGWQGPGFGSDFSPPSTPTYSRGTDWLHVWHTP